MPPQPDDRKCEVCGKRLHKFQTCNSCGKVLCNNHLSRSRHKCRAVAEPPKTEQGELITDSISPTEPKSEATSGQLPLKPIFAGVIVVIAVLGAVFILGGNGSGGEANETNGPLPYDITDVGPGSHFSIELSMSKITEYMMESMDRGEGTRPGGILPGGGMPGGGPFGNDTIPDEFRNRTRPGGFGFMGGISEFLVAVPDALEVEDPTSSTVNIRVIRESQSGFSIYSVNITNLSFGTYDPSNPPSVDLNLTAPLSTGTHDIYVTTVMFSGLYTSSAFRRVIGNYTIGDLIFLIKERVEVG
jgi:hypothetical protein